MRNVNRWRGVVVAAAVVLASMGFSRTATAADDVNLTGKWTCDDGGTYYLRQTGKEVWWLGQSGNGGQDWTNVLHGSIRGRMATGDWADVPAGASMGSGTLTLQLVIRDGQVVEIRKKQQLGDGFGGEVWTRAPCNGHFG